MEIIITLSFREVGNLFECTSFLNEEIYGIGKTKEDAERNYFKNYNVWSNQVSEQTEKELKEKGIKYTMQKFTLSNSQ